MHACLSDCVPPSLCICLFTRPACLCVSSVRLTTRPSQHNFNQIKLIQKKAIRIITDSTYTAHTAPLFAQLQILPYELIIKQAKLLFMHSIEYNYAPTSFLGIWTKNYIIQGDRPLRNADNYTLPNPRTELFKKSPLYTLPLEWNMLDENRYIRQNNV